MVAAALRDADLEPWWEKTVRVRVAECAAQAIDSSGSTGLNKESISEPVPGNMTAEPLTSVHSMFYAPTRTG